MMPNDLPIASFHAGTSAFTYNVPFEARRTVVALPIAGPTARRQANATFSSVSGALRITSASTAGITLLAWITTERIASAHALDPWIDRPHRAVDAECSRPAVV